MPRGALLTLSQKRALHILYNHRLKYGLEHGRMVANAFALQMWPDSPSWSRFYNSGGFGAPMRMLGGSYLSKLEKRGWVISFYNLTNKQWLFRITQKGIDILTSTKEVET